MGLMKGKKGLVVGVANDRSLAWGIASVLASEGAQIGFTYPNDQMKKRVNPLAQSIDSQFVEELDVANDDHLKAVFKKLKEQYGELDFIVHSVAFSDKSELKGPYYNTSRSNFLNTMDISVYSFTALARHAVDLMPSGGSMLTLSFFGAQKAIPNYNVMGVAKAALESSARYLAADMGPKNIRVNAISAGPVRTLASSGIGNFKSLFHLGIQESPLGRHVTQEEVGKAALYLLSDLSTATTGEILYVDSGFQACVGFSMFSGD